MEVTHLPRIVKADLSHGHTAVFLEVRPWRVYHGDVILLVALDGVRLGQLRQVFEQRRRYVVPCLGGGIETEIDVCGGEVVDVELACV